MADADVPADLDTPLGVVLVAAVAERGLVALVRSEPVAADLATLRDAPTPCVAVPP